MGSIRDINEYVASLKASRRLGKQVVHHEIISSSPADIADPQQPWHPAIVKILTAAGIGRFYCHQAKALNQVRSGRHTAVATPTASGKSLIYQLPLLEMVLDDPDATTLYISPLKALAQDQLRAFEQLTGKGDVIPSSAAVYDGDTSSYRRRQIRQTPPNMVMTNPEMVHLSLLAHHPKWAAFFSSLALVVVDEVHTYRGIFGSHMAQVFRRLLRVCNHYGSTPTFVFSSATVANPVELAVQLTGLSAHPVTQSGAPRGRQHVIFLDPADGPVRAAIDLLKAALHRRLRTIVYTQSRKLAELIALWAGKDAGPYTGRIAAYRAGLLPTQRREVEQRLATGQLLAVVSTSALELGIDIGDLDLCLLVGYPGSVLATWQRGGRVGRGGQDSALVLIAGEDALDQYFMRNPRDFLGRKPEAAVANPDNPRILAAHLPCAAAELTLKTDEPFLENPVVRKVLADLEKSGALLRGKGGNSIFFKGKSPHRRVDFRGVGARLKIVTDPTGKAIGEIDKFRALRDTHPGAIYLHGGTTYQVTSLDLAAGRVSVRSTTPGYYTRVRSESQVDILDIVEQSTAWGAKVFTGRLRVTDRITGYEKLRARDRQAVAVNSLDLPPLVFETEGTWVTLPPGLSDEIVTAGHDFLGSIHAVEHAAIGIFPLLVMADRNDLGGLSTPYHPEVEGPVIFIYDGVPGGAGLTREVFSQTQRLLEHTLKAIESCPCEAGCPSCVHSPKCGSGNRPINKAGARRLLLSLKKSPAADPILAERVQSTTPAPVRHQSGASRYGVLDLETRRSAQEVGGWHRADRMGVSTVVVYDSGTGEFTSFSEDRIPEMIEALQQLDLVVGFNIIRFDYRVLSGHSDFPFDTLPTLDMLASVHDRLGFRLSLDHLARATLGTKKSADGLQALRWWRQGRIEEIIAYCKKDVEITRDLYRFGCKNGYLLFENRDGDILRVPVNFSNPIADQG